MNPGDASPWGSDPGRQIRRLIIVLIVVDISLITANVIGAPSFLDLDQEQNFPTWYSSAKLLGTAMVALWCMAIEPRPTRRGMRSMMWTAVAVLFLALSIDETSSAHERLAAAVMSSDAGEVLRTRVLGGDGAKDAFIWPILFAPVIVAIIYFLVIALCTLLKGNRRSIVLGLTGCAAFGAAVILEGLAVYRSPPVETWGESEISRYFRFAIVEESAEIIGATLMLAALALHVAWLARQPSPVEPTIGSPT